MAGRGGPEASFSLGKSQPGLMLWEVHQLKTSAHDNGKLAVCRDHDLSWWVLHRSQSAGCSRADTGRKGKRLYSERLAIDSNLQLITGRDQSHE